MKLNLSLIFWGCALLLLTTTTVRAQDAGKEPQKLRQFDPDFQDHYSGKKYNYEGREVLRSSTSKFDDRSKYSENTPNEKQDNNNDMFSFNFNIVNGIFILILILAVSYLAYILFKDGRSQLFSHKTNQKLNAVGDITVEALQYTDIKALIARAENERNYRLAIRYYYLLVLKQLTMHNFITYTEDKTNADYLDVLASQQFSQKFAYTSYIYNYAWYGKFSLDFTQYQVAKDQFVQLLKEVNS